MGYTGVNIQRLVHNNKIRSLDAFHLRGLILGVYRGYKTKIRVKWEDQGSLHNLQRLIPPIIPHYITLPRFIIVGKLNVVCRVCCIV